MRPLLVAVLVLVPAAWVAPAWVGSGNPLSPGMQARSEPSWSLSLAPVPWRAALEVAQGQAWLMLELSALVAVLLALPGWRAGRRGLDGARPPGSLLPRPAQPGAVVALAST